MNQSFGQAATPLNVIRAIINRYPYSFGQISEIEQNSEDAGASTQSFALDWRQHPTISLYHPNLAHTQGPALLAYNDAEFDEKDWHALQYAHESSKADDLSKIGKFGVGFRSLFHLTDCPQIVSANYVAMFDPLSAYTGSQGFREDFSVMSSRYPDQIKPFDPFMPHPGDAFKGTIIRCPLRAKASKISSKTVQPQEIVDEIFHKYINDELHISLLFLRNLRLVDFREISKNGVTKCLAKLSISRSTPEAYGGEDFSTHILTTKTIRDSSGSETIQTWRVLTCSFPRDQAIELISDTFSGDAITILRDSKLLPSIGIAFALNRTPRLDTSGQLFTYLPLPIPTGFPVHIHGLFSIEESRQHLVNAQAKGVVQGSDSYFVILWNRLLFDHFIPQAWKMLLEILVTKDNISNIFDVWPPLQGSPTSGEGVYWTQLPQRLFAAVTSSMSCIWPLYRPGQSSSSSELEYRSLDLLISAEPSTPTPLLDALTTMGLRFTRLPAYIHDLIKTSGGFKFLCPEVAHEALLVREDAVRNAPKECQHKVFEYLLSNGNVNNIVGLPLVPIIRGSIVALVVRNSSGIQSHTMLNEVEYGIFGACDDDAILLQHLPAKAAETLRSLGPNHLNVEKLSISRIVEYLTIYPNKLGLDLSLVRMDHRAIKWLSAFWCWVNTYEQKDELLTKIQDLYLLPSTKGLRKTMTPLFKSLGEHPKIVQSLSLAGIPFLDADLKDVAQNVLEAHQLLKKISDLYALLGAFPQSIPTTTQGKSLTEDACNTILRHVAVHLQGFTVQNGFTVDQTQQLKRIPIFPMASFPPSGLVVTCSHIPEGLSLISIDNPPFLPIVEGSVFIKLNIGVPPTILDLLGPSSSRRMSDLDILSLTIENFASQPYHVQAAALRYLTNRRGYIPPNIFEKLRNIKFVVVMDGSHQKAMDVVHPGSKLVSLYKESPSFQPRLASDSDKEIIRLLQDLGMLRSSLTTPVVQERINFLSETTSSNAIHISRELLTLILTSRFDCSGLKFSSNQRWLPTDKGLRASGECRDAKVTSPNLFDRVLDTMHSFNIPLPGSLIHVLGWDIPLSREILIRQLDRVLVNIEDDIFLKVHDIIKELSARSCNPTDFAELKKVTSGRKWVPTTDRQLAETQNAVFLPPIPESGFYQVLSLDKKMREFLERMGCQPSPTADAVISNLKALQEQASSLMSLNQVIQSIKLLRSLPTEIDDLERAQLLISDSTHRLRPISDVYFNDIGNHAGLVSSGDDHISHDLLEESLARKLGLPRLGLKYVDLSDAYIDMGQDLVTTVRNNLQQYKDKQFMSEFLANAVDANATEFSFFVNLYQPSQEGTIRALSAQMIPFCFSPSLVVYNNAIFTDSDFIGIRRTGIGGKEGNGSTIGQFGLGSLTMFHFTEMAIVISNSSVLFLNPSKEHLPIQGQASLMLPLKRVKEYYPSHLVCIDGMFGFSISSDESFNGTIFILPLRDSRHFQGVESRVVSQRTYTVEDMSHILQDFKHSAIDGCSASEYLLFTKLEKISQLHHSSSGYPEELWSVSASRTEEEIETSTRFSSSEVLITDSEGGRSTWQTVKRSVPRGNIPQDIISPILSSSRPRLPALAGLAVRLTDSSAAAHTSHSHRFFSTLPLSLQTSLPAHIMASFLLSPDRRSIRLDMLENKFNTWLLSNIIPPLYLFLLQQLLVHGDNKQWWPGHLRGQAEDPYSRLIIDAFFEDHLKICDRYILHNLYDHSRLLTPQEAVLSGAEPVCVERVLSILRPDTIAKPAKSVFQLMKKSGLSVVTPEFVKMEILRAASSGTLFAILSQLQDVDDTIMYLLGEKLESSENLQDLPILPLENGTLGIFQSRVIDTLSNFYIWMPQKSTKHHNFPPQYFVHPNLKKKLKSSLLRIDANVAVLDVESITRFVSMMFPSPLPLSSPFHASVELANWIDDFWESWDEYAHLGLLPDHVSEFPLVPTIRPNSFVTLQSCKEISSLLVGGSTEQVELVRMLLDNLGINIVRVSSEGIPRSLLAILLDGNYPPFNLENVLKALAAGGNDITQTILGMDGNVQSAFASWARSNIDHDISPGLQPIAQRLPLWVGARSGLIEEFCTASDVHMLPQDLPLSVAAPFMSVQVAEYGTLRFLNGPRLRYEQLREILTLPDVISRTDLQPYHQFLEIWLSRLPPAYKTVIPIPNAILNVRPSDTLYARDPLFEAVFGRDSDRFIHPELQQLEQALHKHGLKTESDLDMAIFIECAEVLDSTDDDDMEAKVARATALFEAYGSSLPMHIATKGNQEELWHDLDDYAFIPRAMNIRRILPDQDPGLPGLSLPPRVMALEQIVTPVDVVRQEFESIAWTQRASFANQPNQRVTLAYPEFGRPTILEVIEHVRTLSQLENLSSSQRLIVIHDLRESYRYLNDRAMITPSDVSIGHEIVFLNVDNPDSEEWRWDSAENLVFERDDIDDKIRHVRRFLLPFEELLRATGAFDVFHPQYPSSPTLDDSESKLQVFRSGFQKLREDKQFVDVAFVAADADPDDQASSILGHRSFLAVCSEYFHDRFCGGFQEAGTANSETPILCEVDYSIECVRSVLDYVYIGTKPAVEEHSIKLILDIMQLSSYWRLTVLFEDIQREISDKLLKPRLIEQIRSAASLVHADKLVQTCLEYEERNEGLMQKAVRT